MGSDADQKHIISTRKRQRLSEVLTHLPGLLDAVPADPERRAACEFSLREFCERYLPEWFPLAWSESHLLAIDRLEAAILRGDQFALAMPRGSGKTTLCRAAILWAMLYGHSPYSVLIHATEKASERALKAIQTTLRFSRRFADDWPLMIEPIRLLAGDPRKALAQTLDGEPTNIGWTAERIVMPSIKGEIAAEAVIECAGITGEIRGKQHVRINGDIVRPAVAVVDDPQTRRSARSEADVRSRLDAIQGDIGYLAGPGRSNGVVVPCTVIRRGDVADQLLDRDEHPEFHGQRIRFFELMPSDDALKHWEGEYSRLRRIAFAEHRTPDEATDYYRRNRASMDAGAKVYWPERFDRKKGEISAIQHGMNLLLRDRASFLAEYQNEPEDAHDLPPITILDEAQIAKKCNGLKAGIAPEGTGHIVGMIDVHDALLYYCVVGVASDYSAGVVAYSTYPQQPSSDFRLTTAKITLQDKHPGSKEDAIQAGLIGLFDLLFGQSWLTADGKELPMSRLLVDTGYMPEVVRSAIQRSEHKERIAGSRGVGLTPESKPFSEYDLSPKRVAEYGPKDEPRWYVPASGALTRSTPGVIRFDKYFWLAALHSRFATPSGRPSGWELFGDKYTDHRSIASHLHGQTPVEVSARGRSIVQWKPVKGKEDHWLDCLVGCMVAASYVGAALPGRPVAEPEPDEPEVSLAELYAMANA